MSMLIYEIKRLTLMETPPPTLCHRLVCLRKKSKHARHLGERVEYFYVLNIRTQHIRSCGKLIVIDACRYRLFLEISLRA